MKVIKILFIVLFVTICVGITGLTISAIANTIKGPLLDKWCKTKNGKLYKIEEDYIVCVANGTNDEKGLFYLTNSEIQTVLNELMMYKIIPLIAMLIIAIVISVITILYF